MSWRSVSVRCRDADGNIWGGVYCCFWVFSCGSVLVVGAGDGGVRCMIERVIKRMEKSLFESRVRSAKRWLKDKRNLVRK
jgi:hypothetical protein